MNHQTRVYNSVFEMMPDDENPSPMVRINQMNPAGEFQLFAKLEWFNPFGSVKDRAAWEMLLDLEKRGEVGAGRGVVEPTSGNTGISLAAMAR
ncbi:MAG TPA: pyridoxal-phosphate dependent enzyme, partial [Verrucomicrobiae bacterium]|nr:pyridoxal-phosphate dependent enzyme [Verrucomicrobiae bacterium]